MQGRLSPPEGGHIQSFPLHSWREEFSRARTVPLSCIEWVYEHGSHACNPLTTDEGTAGILRTIADTGVRVSSICADYFMDRQLVTSDGDVDIANVEHLRWLIQRAAAVDARHIVVPFVDRSAIRTEARAGSVIRIMKSLVEDARAAGVELHLETDLAPDAAAGLLKAIGSAVVRANFDIGNSASLGFDPRHELRALEPWLGSVHVKDRRLGNATVPLGTGAAEFRAVFQGLQTIGFRGPLIMQTARGRDGDEIALAIHNRAFVQSFFAPA